MTLMNAYHWNITVLLAFSGLTAGTAAAEVMTKPQVANLITKVENGVDEFRDYLKRRGENASDAGSTAQSQARRSQRGAPSQSQKATAGGRKDELDDALGQL